MTTKNRLGIFALLLLGIVLLAPDASRSLDVTAEDTELKAGERVFFESGLRTVGVRRDAEGNYYVLNMRDKLVWVYNKFLNPTGRIGGVGMGQADLDLPRDFAVARDGRVIVADWAGDKVNIYGSNGVLLSSIPLRRPWSAGVLSTGEILASGPPREHLVSVLSPEGKLLRAFGELIAVDTDPQLNALMNTGRIYVDRSDNIYYLFVFLPTPTIRKYDREGKLLAVYHPDGERLRQSAQRAQEELEKNRAEGSLGGLTVINALAVDEETGDLWVSCNHAIYRLNTGGETKATYQFKHPQGHPTAANDVLIEGDRILVISWHHGVFITPKP